MMANSALIIFSRLPVGHEVKTRLAPLLSESQREKLMLAMWRDIFCELIKLPESIKIFFYWTGSGNIDSYRKFIPERFIIHRQSEGSLGVRMLNAIRDVIDSGFERVAIIGSDIPSIRHEYILEAFEALETCDVVLEPSLDGGYWLIAMKRALREAFDIKQWGNASVLESTIKSLQESGLTFDFIHELDDLDTPEDVKNFLLSSDITSNTYKFLKSVSENKYH